MAAYPGRNSVVYMSTVGTGAATMVVKLNKWTLNRDTDTYDVTAFGDTNKTYVQGLPDLKGSFGGTWDDTESKPFTGAASSDGVQLYFYPSSLAPGKFWTGPAWTSVSMDAPVSGPVSINCNFVAKGSWTNTM